MSPPSRSRAPRCSDKRSYRGREAHSVGDGTAIRVSTSLRLKSLGAQPSLDVAGPTSPWFTLRVTCPKCGGYDRLELAPGWFECRSKIEVDYSAPVPGGVYGYAEQCGHRYQSPPYATSGPSAPFCDCGVASVGLCVTCRKPFCGIHAPKLLTNGRNLCNSCRLRSRKAEKDERLARYQGLPQATTADLDRWLDDTEAYVDGTTHSFWRISNFDVARFLLRNGVDLTTFNLTYKMDRMDGDGNRHYSRPAPGSPFVSLPDGGRVYKQCIHEPAGGPNVRFNDVMPKGDVDWPQTSVHLRDSSFPWEAGRPWIVGHGVEDGVHGLGRGLDVEALPQVIDRVRDLRARRDASADHSGPGGHPQPSHRKSKRKFWGRQRG
jgi:hypothetical protein